MGLEVIEEDASMLLYCMAPLTHTSLDIFFCFTPLGWCAVAGDWWWKVRPREG